MDQLPPDIEPLSPQRSPRSQANIQTAKPAHKKDHDHHETEVFTVAERPLMVFEGGAAGEPLWKKVYFLTKHYGLIVIGFIFLAIFLGVRINVSDPYSEQQSYTLGVALMMTCWWLSSAGEYTFF